MRAEGWGYGLRAKGWGCGSGVGVGEQAARLGLASIARCERRLQRVLCPRGTLRWARIFRTAGQPSTLPLKLEVASGTGDWAAAQAMAEVGTANWAALELRHDRVYDIFSRMVLQVTQ